MRSIVSLCEITHHGLHEWNWKRGGGGTGVCSSEELGGSMCGQPNQRARGAAVCACVCLGWGVVGVERTLTLCIIKLVD